MEDSPEITDYTSMKVSELKDILRDRGLFMGGSKDELIQRLEERYISCRISIGNFVCSDHAPKEEQVRKFY